MFGIQRNADPESVFLCGSSRQLEPRPNRARARNQARPTHRSPRAALRPSIVQHDGRWRPAALSGKPVHARRQERQQQLVRPEAQRRFQINHFSTRNTFILFEPRQPSIHPTTYKNIWFFEPVRGRLTGTHQKCSWS